jgi:hypothetical protein
MILNSLKLFYKGCKLSGYVKLNTTEYQPTFYVLDRTGRQIQTRTNKTHTPSTAFHSLLKPAVQLNMGREVIDKHG